MSKKVIWEDKPIGRPAGTYRTYADFVKKAETLRVEQEEAQAYLLKALPAMKKLLEIRFASHEPLTVIRPLRYQTSVLESTLRDDIDKSFYNERNARPDKFVIVTNTVVPGTQLILKGVDPNLREFIFKDALGVEHCISYDEQNALMTQTDVFETVRDLFEGGKLKV